jgi:hypothetical protein
MGTMLIPDLRKDPGHILNIKYLVKTAGGTILVKGERRMAQGKRLKVKGERGKWVDRVDWPS